ncbi:protein kinase, partial [Streptomyces acidicola]
MTDAYAVRVPKGYLVGGWEVREPIATGAFGSVYAARRAEADERPRVAPADEPADDLPAQNLPAHDPPAHDLPAHDPPAHDLPAHDPPAHDLPAHDPPAHDL